MSKPKGTYSGAVLRAAAAERFAAQDPAAQARSHEASFLRHMSQAREDFDWIVANEAWVHLGHETFADWWDVRVKPIAASLGMRPTREIAKTVIEKVVEDQKDLPKAQQRSQREIAAMVGVSQKSVSRSLTESNDSTADLGEAATDPVDAMHAALEDIDAHLAGQAGQHTGDHTDEGDGRGEDVADPSALPEAFGASSGSAPAEQEGSSSDSPPVDERPQANAGVSSPAAVPQQSPSLAAALDSPEARAASLRRDLHGFMEAGWKVIDQIDPGEIAPALKPQVIEDVANFRRAIDGWLAAIGAEHRQYTRPRLVKEA